MKRCECSIFELASMHTCGLYYFKQHIKIPVVVSYICNALFQTVPNPSKNGKLVTTLPHGCCNLVYNLVR